MFRIFGASRLWAIRPTPTRDEGGCLRSRCVQRNRTADRCRTKNSPLGNVTWRSDAGTSCNVLAFRLQLLRSLRSRFSGKFLAEGMGKCRGMGRGGILRRCRSHDQQPRTKHTRNRLMEMYCPAVRLHVSEARSRRMYVHCTHLRHSKRMRRVYFRAAR